MMETTPTNRPHPRRRLAKWGLALGLFALSTAAGSAEAAYTCGLGIDSYASLNALPKKACDTFAPSYTQACGSDSFTFTPTVYGHFHLGMQNNCYGTCLDTKTGCMGYDKACLGIGTGCGTIADPATQPRTVASHVSNEVVSLIGAPNPGTYCLNGTCIATSGKLFRPVSIKVLGTLPVRVDGWFIKTKVVNGKTVPYKEQRYWASLAPGNWTFTNEGPVDKLTVTAASSSAVGPFQFDNLVVAVD
jgi:hypothetical protein